MSKGKGVYERIYTVLFKNPDKIDSLTSEDRIIKQRWEAVFTKWLDDPAMTGPAMVTFLQSEFGISRTQAYNDINNVQLLLGNVNNAAKEWQRYTAIAMIKQGYDLINNAKDELDVKRGNGMVKAGEALGKVTKLDKEEADPLPYDEIVPQTFEPSGDITVLGIKPIENLEEKKARLRQKYNIDIEDAKVVPDGKA